MAIACVYCGDAHEAAAEVKACWSSHQGDGGADGGADRAEAVATHERRQVVAPEPRRRAVIMARTVRGPVELGRNVIVGVDDPAPTDWSTCERVVIDHPALTDPAATVALLRSAAFERRSVVFEIVTPFDDPPAEIDDRATYRVGARHRFLLDELHQLVWSNSIDARDPATANWWLLDAAAQLGATPSSASSEPTEPDITLPDGRVAWLDGGALHFHGEVGGDRAAPVLSWLAIEHGALNPPSTNGSSADLAPDQLAAVCHPGGAARIIAPAGSGKTRVLTERARHLVVNWQLPAGSVSLVAFNKRAQVEMQERTADLPGLQVRTLNAMALAIVNGSAPFASQPRRWRTLDEPDVRRIIGKLVSFPRRRNTDPVAPWIEALSQIRLGLLSPSVVEEQYDGDVDGLAEVWPQYRAALDREGAVDFDDQVHRAIELLLTEPDARRVAQRACRLLLVDEFQDLTPAHLLLVRLLTGATGAVFGVGDDDQTIYGYNGADPAWLIDFADLFPGSGDHPLEVNYRCPAGIVEAADRLLRHNRDRVPKTIRSAAAAVDVGVAVAGWSASTSDDPVGASVAAVRSAIESGVGGNQIAVLTRVNATLAPVQVALTDVGVPISIGVGAEFLERTAVRAVMSWLRLATARKRFSPDDLREAIRRPSRPLHPRIGDWVTEQDDIDGLRRLAARLNKERDTQRVNEFADDIAMLRSLAGGGATTRRMVEVLIDDVGLGGAVSTLDANRHGMNRGAQGDDLTAVRHLARLHDDPSDFERWIRDSLLTRRDPEGVVMATIHRVKGQEWPHVVVHLADIDQFPHRLADDVEEERRLFHVAITRASEHATIVSGEQPSAFVGELVTEPPEHPPEAPSRRPPRPTEPERSTRRRPGDASDHPLLDRTVVMAVPGLVLVDQGTAWTVIDIEPEAAVAGSGGAVRRFRIGAKVETAGRQRGALGGRSGDVSEVTVRAYDLLRQFREQARNGKPAYTVFDDKTLAATAAALPGDLSALSKIKGVGPAKLESFGDAVLEVIAAAADPDDSDLDDGVDSTKSSSPDRKATTQGS